MNLEPGMVFAVCSDSWLASAINWCQKVKATDNESEYNHAGLITSRTGTTFEALSKIGYGRLSGYKDCHIIIAKHRAMTDDLFNQGFKPIKTLDGSLYPAPRLALHLLGLAKFVHWKYPVCSELVAKFEFEAGLRKNWWGINPDNLADEWKISKYYDVIYEGVL
jgi:hypothetical protein